MNERDGFAYESPPGRLICTFDGRFLTALSIDHSHAYLPRIGGRRSTGSGIKSAPEPVQALFAELDAYFLGELQVFSHKLYRMEGTRFEKTVWEALLEIPYGEVRTYKWLAERIGRPRAVRAVGQALGRNPLPIIVPCHRVISSNGTLGGFSCGVEIKKWLLAHEGYKASGLKG